MISLFWLELPSNSTPEAFLHFQPSTSFRHSKGGVLGDYPFLAGVASKFNTTSIFAFSTFKGGLSVDFPFLAGVAIKFDTRSLFAFSTFYTCTTRAPWFVGFLAGIPREVFWVISLFWLELPSNSTPEAFFCNFNPLWF